MRDLGVCVCVWQNWKNDGSWFGWRAISRDRQATDDRIIVSRWENILTYYRQVIVFNYPPTVLHLDVYFKV